MLDEEFSNSHRNSQKDKDPHSSNHRKGINRHNSSHRMDKSLRNSSHRMDRVHRSRSSRMARIHRQLHLHFYDHLLSVLAPELRARQQKLVQEQELAWDRLETQLLHVVFSQLNDLYYENLNHRKHCSRLLSNDQLFAVERDRCLGDGRLRRVIFWYVWMISCKLGMSLIIRIKR